MPDQPLPLDITFYDHFAPHATAGIYTVRASHELWKDDKRVDTEPLPESEQRFEIRAVRFVLNPTSVRYRYPPDGSAGHYDTVLPHITLNRAALPWERTLAATRDRAHAGWLALLVFAEGELPDDERAGGSTVERRVAHLIEPTENGVIGPALAGSPSLTPEVLESPCRTIDVPAEVFARIAPRAEEMFYLQHVRDVTQATRRADNEELTEGRYGVITANRFPRLPGYYAAHLVSLEGYAAHVGPNPPTGHTAVRLCALASWSFHNDTDNARDIPGMLTHLAKPSRVAPAGADNLLLRLTPPPTATPDDTDGYVRRRLDLGYVPLPLRTLSGEQTFAWYRGPFTPVPPQEVPGDGLATGHTTADHALIYEPDHGLFDVSYAAAWTLGRTIGLADPDYAAEITRARRELRNRAAILRKLHSDPETADADPDTPRGLRGLRRLAAEGGRSLAGALTAPEREAPPRRHRGTPLSTTALLADRRAVAALRDTAERNTGSMPAWLDRLALLNGVPFSYLVPDSRMLPAETIRLFRVDQGWLRALAAGATDVGLHTSADRALDGQIRGAVARGRSARLPAAGLLMHSRVVEALPDLPITGYRDGVEITELRRDALSPQILLVLFDGVPDEVVLREPGQGIHFGLDDGDVITLCGLGPDRPGWSLERPYPEGSESVFTRHLRVRADGGLADVLDVRDLAVGLAGAFDRPDLTPAEFALQLVNAPVHLRFRYLTDAETGGFDDARA